MHGIKQRMLIYTVTMTSIIAMYWIFELNSDNWFDSQDLGANLAEFFKASILFVNAGILANCVWSIRSTIKQLHNVFPNEAFIRVHLANTFIYAALYLIFGFMSIADSEMELKFAAKEMPESSDFLNLIKMRFFYDLVYILIIIFCIYMDLFLLYLVYRFTKEAL